MKTIAQQLNVKDFPFTIRDKNGNVIYIEYSTGFRIKVYTIPMEIQSPSSFSQ